ENDPHETTNLFEERPDIAAKGMRLLDEWVAEQMKKSDSPTDPMWVVIQEGGPFHTRGDIALDNYLAKLRKQGRHQAADKLESRHKQASSSELQNRNREKGVVQMTRNNNVFSMIIIPDTQELSTYYPDKLKEMTTWIVDNAEDLNLKKILHVGDVVNNGATREEQYLNHQEAYSLIDVANIPNLIAIGNHDYDNLLHENRDSAMFNKYCGIHKYESKDWFGDSYEHNKAENMYTKLSINGIKFLFLSLEYGTGD